MINFEDKIKKYLNINNNHQNLIQFDSIKKN